MKHKVQRTFDPVGQGAVYAEVRGMGSRQFTVVYDCGNWRRKQSAVEVVKCFKVPCVDILYISHFHADHISLIDELVKHAQIKKVYIPLLSNEERAVLMAYYQNKGQAYSGCFNIVSAPREVFGPKTEVVAVAPVLYPESTEKDDFDVLAEEDYDSFWSSRIVKSNTVERISEQMGEASTNWVFVPHNYEEVKRRVILENLFKSEQIPFSSSVPLTLSFITRYQDKLVKVYGKLNGGMNENSMFLYSGPDVRSHRVAGYRVRNMQCSNNYNCIQKNRMGSIAFSCAGHYLSDVRCRRCKKNSGANCLKCLAEPLGLVRAGCVYTGDGNLNLVNISNEFLPYWDNVGTVLIPHHGSPHNFLPGFLSAHQLWCPVSVGSCSPYKNHPSDAVLTAIGQQNGFPICVTDCFHSRFEVTFEN